MSVDRLRLGVVRIGVPVLVAGAVIGVAGCTGKDPAPTSTTSSSTTTSSPPTTTTSPPPTTSATDLPAAAKAHTPAGAEAFVRYFSDQFNRAWTEPNSAVLPPLCVATSKTCQGWQATAKLLESSHQHFDTPPGTIDELAQVGPGVGGSLRFEMHGHQNAAHVVDSSGKVVKTIDAKPASFVYYVIWAPGGWRVQEVKAGV